MLVCSLLMKSSEGWLVVNVILLLHMLSLFMTSLIQTAGCKKLYIYFFIPLLSMGPVRLLQFTFPLTKVLIYNST